MRQARKRALFAAALACLVVLCARASEAPNILMIQADDLGYGDLGAYGNSRLQTPALDRMAQGGMRFSQYYAGSAVCAPSRNTLMTGQHTGHAWVRRNGEIPLRDEDVTIAEVLKVAGYRTAMIGKWGLGVPGTTGMPGDQGFDYSYGFLDHRHAHRQYTEHLWRNDRRVRLDPDRDYVNDLFTREARDFIARDDRRPFFVYLNYTVPHPELRAPDEAIAPFRGRYPEKPYRNPEADAIHSGSYQQLAGYRSQATPNAARAGMIARMDRDIGGLLDLLRERGLERETLVLFVSDNGPGLHEGGQDGVFFRSTGGLRGQKRELYEGGIRVPMIAYWPGQVPAGRTSTQVMAHWDWLPTLAGVAGADAPAGIDGISMLDALRGRKPFERAPLYWEFAEDGFSQAVRLGDWKAVRPPHGDRLELYDLARDPTESRDVAAEHPHILARVERYLATARSEEKALERRP